MITRFNCSGEENAHLAAEGDCFDCPRCGKTIRENLFEEIAGDWHCPDCANELREELPCPAVILTAVARLSPLTREELSLAATKNRTPEQQARLEEIWALQRELNAHHARD